MSRDNDDRWTKLVRTMSLAELCKLRDAVDVRLLDIQAPLRKAIRDGEVAPTLDMLSDA